MEEVQALSNHMMFLLFKQPDMLPGLAQNKLYQWTKRSLATQWMDIISNNDPVSGSNLNLASALYQRKLTGPRVQNFLLSLAEELIDINNALQLVYEVWADFLIYTANRCSRESHAKKLSNGGELTTILWLMTDSLHHEANNILLHKRRGAGVGFNYIYIVMYVS